MEENKEKTASATIAEIIDIPNANDFQNRPLPSSINYFNINLAIILTTIMITLGVIIAYL